MVNGYVEEALDLVGMEVHGDQTVDTGSAQQVSYKLCADAYTRFVFSVLTCPTEIRNYGDDVTCRSAFGSVNHEQKLHEVV